MRRLLAAALLVLAACASAPGEEDAAPASAMAPQQLNAADHAFLRGAALGGLAELESARLAGDKAQAPAVKAFAERMRQDHGAANAALGALAGKHGVDAPEALDPERRAAQARLQQATGPAFDALYLANQVQEHQQAVQLFQHEIDAGQNAEVKAAAATRLPILMAHLEIARRLLGELTGAR